MRKRKWWILFVIIGVLAVLLAACGDDDDDTLSGDTIEPLDEGAVADVVIDSNGFEPNSLDVSVGSTVTWFNNDDQAHTVTSGAAGVPDSYFDSGSIDSNGSFSFTFDQPGTYTYFCSIHPNMTGTINVTGGDAGGIDVDETDLETAIPGG